VVAQEEHRGRLSVLATRKHGTVPRLGKLLKYDPVLKEDIPIDCNLPSSPKKPWLD